MSQLNCFQEPRYATKPFSAGASAANITPGADDAPLIDWGGKHPVAVIVVSSAVSSAPFVGPFGRKSSARTRTIRTRTSRAESL